MQQKKLIPRILTLLNALRTALEPLSAAETSRRTGLPLQTVHRLLTELAQGGLTFQHARTKAWSLGPAAIGLGASALRQLTVVNIARPVLEEVAEATSETVMLTLRDGAFGSYVDVIESPRQIRLVEMIGTRLPLHIGAARLAIIAALPLDQQEAIFDELRKDGHLTDVAAIRESCQAIRKRGYAVSDGSVTAGSVCIAMAVVSEGYPVRVSIAVSGPEDRFDNASVKRVIAALTRATQELAARLAEAYDIPGPESSEGLPGQHPN